MQFNSVGAVAIAATAFFTHALPQADIEEPDYCAECYINENCRTVGPASPYADGLYYHNDPAQMTEQDAHHYHGGAKSND
jgi:hypothetical protein